MTAKIKANHDLPHFLVGKTSENGALLVALSKLYLAEKLMTKVDAKQFMVFIIPDGRRGLVRLHPGASCERGMGREDIKSPDFHDKFDVYLKPEIDQWYFTFTIQEPGEVKPREYQADPWARAKGEPQGMLFEGPRL